MQRCCFVWTPTPPLAGRRTPRPGPVRVFVCSSVLAGSGEPASRAGFGAPHLFLWLFCLSALFDPLRGGVAPFLVLCLSPPPPLFALLFPAPGALGLGAVCWLFVAWWLPPPPLCVSRFFLPPLRALCFFSSPLVCAPVVSLFLWFPPWVPWALELGFCLAVGCSLVVGAPPPLPFCVARFLSAQLGAVFFFPLPSCAPVVFDSLWFPAPGALGLALCFVCLPGLPLLGSRLASVRSLLVAAPPPPARCSVLFFLFLCPRCPWLSLVSGPGCPGPRRCALFASLASRFSALRALSPGRWLLPGGFFPPPPLLCLAVFVASPRCCVPCAVLCCVSRGAVLRHAAARCVARCCAVVCCVVSLRSFGAGACCAVPFGAARRPGALCFAVLCFPVFPPAVCVLSWRGGACRCSPLCFVLCVSWGAVLCIPCLLCSVWCCASLCWCACVVLFVWCVLLLAPRAEVRCCVLCCFLWCAVVRCWVWWPVVVCWCCAVAPCCPPSFAGGVGLCLSPVCAVLCCAALRVVRCRCGLRCCWFPRAVACPCALWCLPGRSAVWWCCSGVWWCLAVLCVVLWCPAPCAVSCGAVLPCGAVLAGCAVRLSALLVFVFPFVLFSFAKNPCRFSVPLKTLGKPKIKMFLFRKSNSTQLTHAGKQQYEDEISDLRVATRLRRWWSCLQGVDRFSPRAGRLS